MPFLQPSLDTLVAQAASDLQAGLPGADPLLANSILNVLAVMEAGGLKGLYGYLDYIAQQSIPFTATGEAFAAWAALKGQSQKLPTAATGQWTFPAAVGAVVPAGTVITRSDGAAYVTPADVTATGSTITVAVTAKTPGSIGTIATGVGGVLSAAIQNVGSVGTGTAGTPGTDLEDFGAFKTRVLALYAQPAQGGAWTDYVAWALSAPGVTRAWCRPLGMGAGTVVVYVMMDVAEAAFGGFPQGTNGVAAGETRDSAATGDQLVVANVIYPLRNTTALVYVNAPGQNVCNFTISLPGASTAIKASVSAAISALMVQNGTPGGVTLASGSAGVLNLSDIEAAVSAISGTAGFAITAQSCNHGSISPGALGNITSNTGYLPVLGTITWA